MRSGELAKQAGVSADTLRHYEKKGLIAAPHRTPNGYREYPDAALARVRLIQRALDMGFSLDDLARVLRQRDRGGAPCHQVRAIAASRLEELDRRIATLQELRAQLEGLLVDWDARLATLAAGQRAGLLDALGASGPRVTRPRARRNGIAGRRSKSSR